MLASAGSRSPAGTQAHARSLVAHASGAGPQRGDPCLRRRPAVGWPMPQAHARSVVAHASGAGPQRGYPCLRRRPAAWWPMPQAHARSVVAHASGACPQPGGPCLCSQAWRGAGVRTWSPKVKSAVMEVASCATIVRSLLPLHTCTQRGTKAPVPAASRAHASAFRHSTQASGAIHSPFALACAQAGLNTEPQESSSRGALCPGVQP